MSARKERGVGIRVLPDSVASAIAAGEVVERPASVVKELLENALDAEARSIGIEIGAAGQSEITVSDDGAGIPADEVALAVARYATSKLKSVDDLFAIRTLGFRGEALASIAAVSRLEIVTRAEGTGIGVRLTAEGGQAATASPIGAPIGTVVRVRDLFYNVPARRKFLKSESTERRRITELVTRYALAYPQVRFELTHEGRDSFHTSGSGDAREVLAQVYGLEAGKQMIPLPESDASPPRLSGFISPPALNRTTRKELTFFVNGRWVQDSSLAAAVLQAYHALLMVGKYPIVLASLELPPEDVDVNVHPTKSEIRFRDPGKIFAVVQRTVRATLLGQSAIQGYRFEPDSGGWAPAESGNHPDWAVAAPLLSDLRHLETPNFLLQAGPQTGMPLLRPVGQVGATYLVAEGPDGIYLVDQHAAHERVLYEALVHAWKEGRVESQSLLEPVTVELSPSQSSLIKEQLDTLRALGFEVEEFGRGAYQLRSIPVILQGLRPEQALLVAVEDFEEDEEPLRAEVEARLAARVCKRAAVKSGQVLSLQEQERLLRNLETCASPRTCPHGRPTMIHLSVDALERQFGRRG